MSGALFNLFKPWPRASQNSSLFSQPEESAGLLVTSELEKALAECKTKVDRIAKDCKRKNRKFRDIEFDLETDQDRCLHGLGYGPRFAPSDCQRVTQIFDAPQFFIDGASADDIIQGDLADCWFVSALATMSTTKGLVEKCCVARDEKVGVYGFIFFRDSRWVTVIIDDLLYTSIPKYEELHWQEKALYHKDKTAYDVTARKSGKSLYFAQSGTPEKTWVPLLEKAYAKLHGCYAHLSGGSPCEAIEDMTGGVSSSISVKDILDIDEFWTTELLKWNQDRLFSCHYGMLSSERSGELGAKVDGLISDHSYSILRAIEVNGRRFLVVRNPWGGSEWTGPWSDGSKNWTSEWLARLPELGHKFGDDGQFVMEYKDFLASWDVIQRTILFDSSWIMSSQWLHVQTSPLSSAWTYGDVTFVITVSQDSPAIIVLSQLDERYFSQLAPPYVWMFDFVVFKKGDSEPVAESLMTHYWARSVNVELDLEKGDYVVHVRLDRRCRTPKPQPQYDPRSLARATTELSISQSIAMNFKPQSAEKRIPIPLELLAGKDLVELELNALELQKKQPETAKPDAMETPLNTEEFEALLGPPAGRAAQPNGVEHPAETHDNPPSPVLERAETFYSLAPQDFGSTQADKESDFDSDDEQSDIPDGTHPGTGHLASGAAPFSTETSVDSVFLGLRVYTKNGCSAIIKGQLRHEMEMATGSLRGKTVI